MKNIDTKLKVVFEPDMGKSRYPDIYTLRTILFEDNIRCLCEIDCIDNPIILFSKKSGHVLSSDLHTYGRYIARNTNEKIIHFVENLKTIDLRSPDGEFEGARHAKNQKTICGLEIKVKSREEFKTHINGIAEVNCHECIKEYRKPHPVISCRICGEELTEEEKQNISPLNFSQTCKKHEDYMKVFHYELLMEKNGLKEPELKKCGICGKLLNKDEIDVYIKENSFTLTCYDHMLYRKNYDTTYIKEVYYSDDKIYGIKSDLINFSKQQPIKGKKIFYIFRNFKGDINISTGIYRSPTRLIMGDGSFVDLKINKIKLWKYI